MDTLGLLYTIVSTCCLGANKLAVRKSLFGLDESYATLISILISIPIFGIPLLFLGFDAQEITTEVILLFVIIGLTNYVGGRYFIWKSISLVGANRGTILGASQIVYAVVIAIVFLNQRIDLLSALGVALVLLGIFVISYSKIHSSKSNSSYSSYVVSSITSEQMKTGLIYGLAGGFFWGVTQDLMQIAITVYKDPIGATFFTYITSLVGIIPIVILVQSRSGIENKYRSDRKSFIFVVVATILGGFGQYYKYAALQILPVTVVATVNGTNPMITLILSYFLIREVEVIDRRTILGIISSVLGVVLVSF
ncbi:MAG TPA: EamA family transporter [Nitrososphaerales archaeon]|nr:EamA family transporter [Nitrososphaerales archaeon]